MLDVQGGPAPARLACAFCGAALTGHPKHVMWRAEGKEDVFFCNRVHEQEYVAEQAATSVAA